MSMNNSVHSSLAHTPFFLNTGLNPITPIMLEVLKDGKVKCAQALQYAEARKEAFDAAMEYLKKARDRYKSSADANRKDTKFQIGEHVLLSTVNLNKHNQVRKLYPNFVGPFKVLGKVNDVAYRLELPASMPIHDVFHVSLLRPYHKGRTPIPYQRTPPLKPFGFLGNQLKPMQTIGFYCHLKPVAKPLVSTMVSNGFFRIQTSIQTNIQAIGFDNGFLWFD